MKTFVVKRESEIRVCGVMHNSGEQFGADEALQEIKNLCRAGWLQEVKEVAKNAL